MVGWLYFIVRDGGVKSIIAIVMKPRNKYKITITITTTIATIITINTGKKRKKKNINIDYIENLSIKE